MGKDKEGDDRWDEVLKYSTGYSEKVPGDDGEPVDKWIDESKVYWEIQRCFSEGKEVRTGTFDGGIWLGGKKYTVTQQDKTLDEPSVPYVNLALKGEAKAGAGGGSTIAYAGGYLVCGFFKKPEQDAGNCNIALTTYAKSFLDV